MYKTIEHQKREEREGEGNDEGKSTHRVKKEEDEGDSTHTITMGMKEEDKDEAQSGTIKRERKNQGFTIRDEDGGVILKERESLRVFMTDYVDNQFG